MALLDPEADGPPRSGSRFTLRVAGAESNVAVGLARLGVKTRWLSESCRELVLDLARRAGERGALVVFDPNYREALWDGPQAALEAQRALFELIDWYLCGSAEASLLFGVEEGDLPQAMSVAGIERAVVRVGARGSLVMTPGGVAEVTPPQAERTEVLDEVGAGDAFAAGFAFGLLHEWPPARCARAGHVIAVHALRDTGDWETLPRLDEVSEELGVAAERRVR